MPQVCRFQLLVGLVRQASRYQLFSFKIWTLALARLRYVRVTAGVMTREYTPDARNGTQIPCPCHCWRVLVFLTTGGFLPLPSAPAAL